MPPATIARLGLASLILVGLHGCAPETPPTPETVPDGPAVGAPPPTAPPLVGTNWRLSSLDGEPPVGGVRPALVFTDRPAVRDGEGRPYGAARMGWSLLVGESGVGPLHAPYRIDGDTLRVSDPYARTRLSTAAERAQAEALAAVLGRPTRLRRRGPRLVLTDGPDTLATFTADPPRAPGPLDDTEWEVVTVDGRPLLEGTRATLTFTSRPAGPGPNDGFDVWGGNGGCNDFGGGYRIEGDRLLLPQPRGDLFSNDLSCGADVDGQEARYLDALGRAAVVRREGGALTLLDSSAEEVVTLRPRR